MVQENIETLHLNGYEVELTDDRQVKLTALPVLNAKTLGLDDFMDLLHMISEG